MRLRQPEVTYSPAAQAKVIKTALEDVTNSEPFLPFPGSVLPALLALRRIHQTIAESKTYLDSQTSVTEREKRQLEADEANLRDQNQLTEALNVRIQELREEVSSIADLDPEEGARQRRKELQVKKKSYITGKKELFEALEEFIDKHLAAMLAAEELGGPVVGDIMDIDSNDLASGFNAQGKAKKHKGNLNEDKRQRRIDEIWGNPESQREDEVTAAGSEMKKLLQALVQQLEEAKGDNSASYVALSRESAAARFLVRSKVAQFHPKDATRLRLVDFGRELDS